MAADEVGGDWRWVATVPDPAQARELAELLEAAGIEVRVEVVGGAEGRLAPDLDYRSRSWTVLVPEAEAPVAIGVAERMLPWFVGESEGELSEAECAAALEEPHEAGFAERLEAERERRARSSRRIRILILLAVALFVVATLVRALLG